MVDGCLVQLDLVPIINQYAKSNEAWRIEQLDKAAVLHTGNENRDKNTKSVLTIMMKIGQAFVRGHPDVKVKSVALQ